MNGDSKSVYAIVLKYPESNKIDLYSISDMVNSQTKVNLLGYDKEIEVRRSDIVKVERVNVLFFFADDQLGEFRNNRVPVPVLQLQNQSICLEF